MDLGTDDAALSKLFVKVEQLPSGLTLTQRLERLWTTPDLYRAHVKRRMGYGHIASEPELAEKTFATLSRPQRARISRGEFPVTEIEDGKWSIILDREGRIKTAYQMDAERQTFTDNQRRSGYQVDDIKLSKRVLETLARLFGPRRDVGP